MTLTICPPLIQQLQPKFIEMRNIFQGRENNSKIYSWFAFTTAAVLVELPYSIVAGSIYFCCWWFGSVGYRVSSYASGYTYLLLMVFELFYVGFGQAIAAISPNELLASLLVPLFFTFVVVFCGILVPPAALPYFWRSWMYWLSPFHYILEGFLAAATHNLPVRCELEEFARFHAPPGKTCQSYVAPYIQKAGGYVQVGANGICELCQFANGDEFANISFSVYYSHIWRDFGIALGFVAFNYAFVYFGTWLRFKVKNPVKGLTGLRAKRKFKKEESEKEKATEVQP